MSKRYWKRPSLVSRDAISVRRRAPRRPRLDCIDHEAAVRVRPGALPAEAAEPLRAVTAFRIRLPELDQRVRNRLPPAAPAPPPGLRRRFRRRRSVHAGNDIAGRPDRTRNKGRRSAKASAGSWFAPLEW